MPQLTKFAAAALLAAISLPDAASARGKSYPLTQCGPGLTYLCRLHGSFDSAPFHYNAAIYPGCIKTVAVETPYGVERHRAVVCGAPERPMVWWW